VIRTHATIAPDDVLQSLVEIEERDEQILAGRNPAAGESEREDSPGTLALVNRKNVPYDPQPVRRRILDVFA
jgi:hypothetical protein